MPLKTVFVDVVDRRFIRVVTDVFPAFYFHSVHAGMLALFDFANSLRSRYLLA
ncbi:MAG: hypothetical protein WD672_01095 [Woeseia sp.]